MEAPHFDCRQREKGACFYCNKKIRLGNQCKKSLQIMLVHEDDKMMGEANPEEEQNWGDLEEEQVEGPLLTAHICLQSIQGWTTPGDENEGGAEREGNHHSGQQ